MKINLHNLTTSLRALLGLAKEHIEDTEIHITEEEKSHIDSIYNTLNNGGRLSTQGKEVFDWNEIKENGFYFSDSSKAVNSPRNLEGDWFFGIVMAEDSEWVVQKLIQYSNNDTLEYMRVCRYGAWSDWENTTTGNQSYFKAERGVGSFTFDNNETSESVRLLIPKDISFWGMLEIDITSVYQFSNVGGGAKILLHLGIDDYLIYGYVQELQTISDSFANHFYIKDLEESDTHFMIEIIKRQFKNPISLTMTAYGGTEGGTPFNFVESISFQEHTYDSILEFPIQVSKYQSLIDEHLNDENVHTTASERDLWNNKTDDSKIASSTELGHVKIGANLTIDADGKLNASPPSPTIPNASTTQAGIVQLESTVNSTRQDTAPTSYIIKSMWDSLITMLGGKANTVSESLKTATLLNGWQGSVKYFKDGVGVVHIYVDIYGGNTTAGTTIFTMPVGYGTTDYYNFPIGTQGAGQYSFTMVRGAMSSGGFNIQGTPQHIIQGYFAYRAS